MTGRALRVTALSIKQGRETAHLRNPTLQVASMTLEALGLVAQGSHPVLGYPVGGMFAGRIEKRGVVIGSAAPQKSTRHDEGSNYRS